MAISIPRDDDLSASVEALLRDVLRNPPRDWDGPIEKICADHPDEALAVRIRVAKLYPNHRHEDAADPLDPLLMECLDRSGVDRDTFLTTLCERLPKHAMEMRERMAMLEEMDADDETGVQPTESIDPDRVASLPGMP